MPLGPAIRRSTGAVPVNCLRCRAYAGTENDADNDFEVPVRTGVCPLFMGASHRAWHFVRTQGKNAFYTCCRRRVMWPDLVVPSEGGPVDCPVCLIWDWPD